MNIRIYVLNIAHFTKTNHHQCKGKKCSHSEDERIDDLLEIVKGLEPQFVVIDWCWSRNGNSVTSLNPFLTKLSLSMDRTFIVGHGGWVEADPEQTKFIDDIDDQLKQFKDSCLKNLQQSFRP